MLPVSGQSISTHYRSEKVIKYFDDEHKDSLIPVWLLPTASPEFMVLEKYVGRYPKMICLYFHTISLLKRF
jgi:hypothetical protein